MRILSELRNEAAIRRRSAKLLAGGNWEPERKFGAVSVSRVRTEDRAQTLLQPIFQNNIHITCTPHPDYWLVPVRDASSLQIRRRGNGVLRVFFFGGESSSHDTKLKAALAALHPELSFLGPTVLLRFDPRPPRGCHVLSLWRALQTSDATCRRWTCSKQAHSAQHFIMEEP